MKKIFALAVADMRNVRRDAMSALAFSAPLMIAGFVRFILPWILRLLLGQWRIDLYPHLTFIKICFALLPPMMFGLVAGYLFLDERDKDIGTYISITPLRKSGYLWFRVLVPMCATTLFFFLYILLSGLSFPGYIAAFSVAVMLGLETALIFLLLAGFAGNKVEGLALSKGTGILLFAPLAGYLLPSNWRFLAGILPTFWVTETFLCLRRDQLCFLYAMGGILVHVFYLAIFLLKYLKDSTSLK